tara:strand:+ start:1352 stop:2395 length:1044 start_codon:yes stop_codon:yes gene_type:complete
MAYTTIDKSTDYFNTKLWNGNSSTQAISGIGFAPDWVWGKQRTGTENHQVLDIIRGANNILSTNADTGNVADSQILNSFDSDGFTLGNQNQLNDTGATYVGWSWKANGAGSANTDGSINTVKTSANTTSGFSISKFVGSGGAATVGHGLGVAPKVIIIKYLGGEANWGVYHQSLGNTGALFLDLTGTVGNSGDYWNSTSPTSTVFSVNTFSGFNYNGGNMIAYCFAEKKGFSKFGSFLGNGEPIGDAPFIYTGFKPAWVMIKSSSYGGQHWAITDNKRLGYNGDSAWLKADSNGAELTNLVNPNLLSNGFSLQNNNDIYNKNGQSYIYMAFAESPFVTSTGIPTTAG